MSSAFQQQPLALPRNTLLNNGRYRIERELNRGGTAVVYAAEDRATRTYVALKVMHGPDQVPLKVVKREITFSSSVSHDNIVRLLDVFAERQQLVIVWELISGPDLLDLLNECGGRMPEDMAAFYFTQALRGLVFMHANGFCHRDIKPENCMVQRANHQLKLIDFGLSKHLASAKTLGVGTPDYMSPEMLVHQHQVGGLDISAVQPPYDARRVDAWAMGVLMYLLVTGRYPFEDDAQPNNLAATVTNVLAGRVRPLPPGTSAGCQELIAGLLQARPERRSTLLDLVGNPWLAAAAAQYAHRVVPPQPGGAPGPEQWIDLREYMQLAAAAAAGATANGSSYHRGTNGPQLAPNGNGIASANGQHKRPNEYAAAPAGPAADGSDRGSGGGSAAAAVAVAAGASGVHNPCLLPAGSGTEDVAAAAGSMRHVAGVHSTSEFIGSRANGNDNDNGTGGVDGGATEQHRHRHHHHGHRSHRHGHSDGERAIAASHHHHRDRPVGHGLAEQHRTPTEDSDSGAARHEPKGALAKMRAYFRRKLDV
ncbi:hypothetical protein GPECTOR_2g1359 [Gonium pectorale]|uniref:Protein kinase domain-containing protein n=1 Tax=Gonium pectorale TaxID=33097 RepID=A0A150H105_GONPE|nr:hypothetical protein GPECTOR_2g1359 [Gonium pectorale]|eukprot:KXZ55809.1 hypothetical protein GPECTOR_2g1359 [Gonium pectorale]